jgi:hypothetical protein
MIFGRYIEGAAAPAPHSAVAATQTTGQTAQAGK